MIQWKLESHQGQGALQIRAHERPSGVTVQAMSLPALSMLMSGMFGAVTRLVAGLPTLVFGRQHPCQVLRNIDATGTHKACRR